ncbi:MAG: cytochrome c biogenesis protein ResB [Deltaproteobacteria bacterium]|nr:cytochrome c biogenesis protein ResB [Deltaproteobacteria bacterium]MBW2086525.1 cytochrome c biogenesis protein ResB [Deltaproteobacteria bacterium]
MANRKTPTEQVISFFASVKLALVLFITLAAASIAGTIIPQNLSSGEAIQRYGPQLTSLFYYLDLFDMYHSWWFNVLLGFLALNLIVCSLKRFPRTLKLARSVSGRRISPGFLEKQPFARQFLRPGSPRENLAEIQKIVDHRFARPREIATTWGIVLLSHKGAFSRFGVYAIHSSLLFILAGALVGQYGGFDAFLNLAEGETTDQVILQNSGRITLPFDVRLDRFLLKRYPGGAPSEYRSDLTFLENGREVRKASVRVNHPFTYRKVTFYQQFYDSTPVEGWGLRLTRRSDKKVFELQVALNRPNILPDGSGTFLVLDFTENLVRSGPAVKLLVRPNGAQNYAVWVFKNRPDGLPLEPGPFSFQLLNYKLRYFSGLQANKDPGVWLIWVGCALLMAGCLVTFFFSHQKLYLGLISEGTGTRIIIGGSAHRNQGSFKIKFERLVDQLNPKSTEDKAPGL